MNLQQLPSTGTRFAKLFKSLFVSNDDWLLVGLDYNALEATIASLTTKDPNRLKVYTDGYDSHCINAYGYFKEHMPDIVQLEESYQGKCYFSKSFNSPLCEESVITYLGKQYTLKDLIKN